MNGGCKVLLEFTYLSLSLPLPLHLHLYCVREHENIFFVCSYLFTPTPLVFFLYHSSSHHICFPFGSIIIISFNSVRHSREFFNREIVKGSQQIGGANINYVNAMHTHTHTHIKRHFSPQIMLGAWGNIIISCCSSITLVIYDCTVPTLPPPSPFKTRKSYWFINMNLLLSKFGVSSQLICFLDSFSICQKQKILVAAVVRHPLSTRI